MPHEQFSAADLLGSIVDDRFEVISKLGEGGMGAVYKARQISMDRQVALKILLHDQRGDPISVERFRHEAYLASRLRHPNAIVIHDFGQSPDGLLYIAMEYLSGETLKDRMTRVGQLPVRSAVKIIGQTLRTISEAHRMGLIHRDLKPDNIFLTTVEGDTDYVKVLDFGIAKLTAVNDGLGGYQGGLTVQGKIYGTPNYMSPEQIRGKPVDHQSDLYQLGVIFYEMLCGRRPFEAQTPVDVMMMHLRDAPPPPTSYRPDVPPELERTVVRALEKDRRLRFQSGDEFLENIENFKFNSGFYAVPARLPGRMSAPTAQTPLPDDDATIAQEDGAGVDESILELGQSALMDAMDFGEEKTVLEFDDHLGFNDPDEKTVFEPDDDDDMLTSADAPPAIQQRPAPIPSTPPPGIHSMASLSAEMQGGEGEMLELDDADYVRADPSLVVPIPEVGGGQPQGRGTIAGVPGNNAPRYVTPAPAPTHPPSNKSTLAGHPGAGFGPPPPRTAAAAPPADRGNTIQRAGPAPIAPAQQQPDFAPPAAPRPAAAPPAAPAMALTPATDAPDFAAYDDDYPLPSKKGGKGALALVLKIVLGLLLVAGTAAAVIVLYPMLTGGGSTEVSWPAQIVVRTEPEGVEVFDTNRYIGDSPTEIELTGPTESHDFQFFRGQKVYAIKATGRSGPAWMYAVLPGDGESDDLGIVEIVSDPPGAQVRRGDVELGRTPLLFVGAPGSKASLVVTRDGAEQTVTAEPTAAGGRLEVKLQ